MIIDHLTGGRHWGFWMIIRVIGLLIALLILPVLLVPESVALPVDLAGGSAGDHLSVVSDHITHPSCQHGWSS